MGKGTLARLFGCLSYILSDRFEERDGVIVIAATNFPEALDKALVRPGRFDKQITVPLPDVKGRKEVT